MNPSNDLGFATLQDIPVRLIDRNPANPRLLFRQGELEQLTDSIRQYGVQVPIAVYQESRRYVLIDGERRWLCSQKLNRPTIPALVQPKPAPLKNLLLMFNIHSLREQWDLMTIAMKLPTVVELLTVENGAKPSERVVAERTGLPRAVIRRSRLLMELPLRYRDQILDELQKPKSKQRLTEDFFIEMERALTTVARARPEILPNRDAARRILIEKYKKGTITNIVQFRLLAKIARSDRVDVGAENVERALRTVFTRNDYSIEQAYQESASVAYLERDLATRIQGLLQRLSVFNAAEIDNSVRRELRALVDYARQLLGE